MQDIHGGGNSQKRTFIVEFIHYTGQRRRKHQFEWEENILDARRVSVQSIKQTTNNLSLHALISLYFGQVYAHLTYCPIILSCTNKSNINCILKVQKKAICIITYSHHNGHTAPLFKNLGILLFDKITKQIILTFMHSIVFNYCSRSRRRAEKVDKRMVLVYTHGLFIT